MDMTNKRLFHGPFTIYSVAALYAEGTKIAQTVYAFTVSGDNPLTEAEAVERAQVAQEARAAHPLIVKANRNLTSVASIQVNG